VNVGEKEISRRSEDANVVLEMESELEIVAPVLASGAVFWQDRVVEKDLQAVEVGAQPVENNNVWRNEEEVSRKGGVSFVETMEEAPSDEEGEHLGLTGTSSEFEHVAGPILGEHIGGNGARMVETKEVEFIASLTNFKEPDGSFHCFALGEVVAKWS